MTSQPTYGTNAATEQEAADLRAHQSTDETRQAADEKADAAQSAKEQGDDAAQAALIADLTARVTALEQGTRPPPPPPS